jgi:DNA-binding transcriptional LysR family regulator
MNVDLARTFLEVASTGSFIAAADRLHLTQTAISARIRTLEIQLGRRLFIRNKAGARLTPDGQRFLRHAHALLQVWERACHEVALPPGRVDGISIGAELSLWNPLMADWLVWMNRHNSDLALRAVIDVPSRLLARVEEGSLDLAVLYGPAQRPDLVVELLAEEKLMLVTTNANGEIGTEDYVHVDWGPAFEASEQAAFPELVNPAISISLGPLALGYILQVGGSGYFRFGTVRPFLADGRLHPVPGAPEFSHSIHLVYPTRSEARLVDRARGVIRA